MAKWSKVAAVQKLCMEATRQHLSIRSSALCLSLSLSFSLSLSLSGGRIKCIRRRPLPQPRDLHVEHGSQSRCAIQAPTVLFEPPQFFLSGNCFSTSSTLARVLQPFQLRVLGAGGRLEPVDGRLTPKRIFHSSNPWNSSQMAV